MFAGAGEAERGVYRPQRPDSTRPSGWALSIARRVCDSAPVMPRWTSPLPASLGALLGFAPACAGDGDTAGDTGSSGTTDGRYFKTGRHVDLLNSPTHAMGVPGATFGDPAHRTGPISELV